MNDDPHDAPHAVSPTDPEPGAAAPARAVVDALDALLPQTQCTRCGYVDCRAYAVAMAAGEADTNRCPPGGAEGVVRLSRVLGVAPAPLDASCGSEGPRALAVIDEAWCIGCTLCIKACPVDCIVGAPKRMHTVVDEDCTGCELCVPVCPVDCIEMVPVTISAAGTATGWAAWSPAQALRAREQYAFHRLRTERARRENDERLAAKAQAKLADLEAHTRHTDPDVIARKRAVVEAAIARARARRQESS